MRPDNDNQSGWLPGAKERLASLPVGDVAEVQQRITRDDTGIDYEVVVSLRSLAKHAFEQGEDQMLVWYERVDFGLTDANVAGGYAFVTAAREQQTVADQVWMTANGRPRRDSV